MTDSRHDHKTVNTSLENTLIYLAPTLLIVTAIIYLVAAVMDFRTSSETERNGFRVFYIVGAALWVTGQVLVLFAIPVTKTDVDLPIYGMHVS